MFLTAEFIILNFDVDAALFERDRSFGRLAGRANVVSGNDFFSAYGYGATIIGVVGKSILSVARNIDPALPDDSIIIATIFFECGVLKRY